MHLFRFFGLGLLVHVLESRKCKNGGTKVFEEKKSILCDNCQNGSTGLACQLCPLDSRRKSKKCTRCSCSAKHSFGSCSRTGKCHCLPRYDGRKCTKCAPGYENYPTCNPIGQDMICLCHPRTSMSLCPSLSSKRCRCKSTKYSGKHCDKCAHGHEDFPGCLPIGSSLRNSDIELTNEFYDAIMEDEVLNRRVRQPAVSPSQGMSRDNVRYLSELRIKYTALEQQWKAVDAHVKSRTKYIKNFLHDANGIMPALQSSLKSLTVMVENLDTNLCSKIRTWEYFEEAIKRHTKSIEGYKTDAEDLERLAEKELNNLEEFYKQVNLEDIPDADELEVLETMFQLEVQRFAELYNETMFMATEAICKTKFLRLTNQSLGGDVVEDLNSYDSFNCEGFSDLELPLRELNEDQDLLRGAEDYAATLRDTTLRSQYKLRQMEEFLKKFNETGMGNMEADADSLLDMYEFMEPQVPFLPGEQFDKILDGFSSLYDVEMAFRDLVTQYDIFNNTASDSVDIVLQNAAEIHDFAIKRKLDALFNSEDYNKLNNTIYKHYQPYMERFAQEYNETLKKVEDEFSAYNETVGKAFQSLHLTEEYCALFFGRTMTLDECRAQFEEDDPPRDDSRKRRELFFDDEDLYMNEEEYGSGNNEGSGFIYERNKSVGCEVFAGIEHCKHILEIEKEFEKIEFKMSVNTATLKIQTNMMSEEIFRWCPDPSDAKYIDVFKNPENGEWLAPEYELALEECQNDNNGEQISIYERTRDFLKASGRKKRKTTKSKKNKSVLDEINAIDTSAPASPIPEDFDLEVFLAEAEEETSKKALKSLKSTLANISLHLNRDGSCAPPEDIGNYTTEYDSKCKPGADKCDCGFDIFKDDAERVKKVLDVSGQIAKSDYSQKLEDLLNEVRSLRLKAQEAIMSSTSSRLARHVDPLVESHDERAFHDLDEDLYADFSQASNGFDLEFTFQTVPSYFTTLFYLGSEADFHKKSKRKRRKRQLDSGDALFFEIEPASNDTNLEQLVSDGSLAEPRLVMYLKQAAGVEFQRFEIPFTDALKGGDTLGSKDINKGWRFHVSLIQRFHDQVQITIRWTVINSEHVLTEEFGSNFTTKAFPIDDSKSFLFQHQRPRIIKRERPAQIHLKKTECESAGLMDKLWCEIDKANFNCMDYGQIRKDLNANSVLRRFDQKLNCVGIAYFDLTINGISQLASFDDDVKVAPLQETNALIITQYDNLNTIPDDLDQDSSCVRFEEATKIGQEPRSYYEMDTFNLQQTFTNRLADEHFNTNLFDATFGVSFVFNIYYHDLELSSVQELLLMEFGDLKITISGDGPNFVNGDTKVTLLEASQWRDSFESSLCYSEGIDKSPIQCDPLILIVSIGHFRPKECDADDCTPHYVVVHHNKGQVQSILADNQEEAMQATGIPIWDDNMLSDIEAVLDSIFYDSAKDEYKNLKFFGYGVSRYSISLDIMDGTMKSNFYKNLIEQVPPQDNQYRHIVEMDPWLQVGYVKIAYDELKIMRMETKNVIRTCEVKYSADRKLNIVPKRALHIAPHSDIKYKFTVYCVNKTPNEDGSYSLLPAGRYLHDHAGLGNDVQVGRAWKYTQNDYFGMRIHFTTEDIADCLDTDFYQIGHFTIKEFVVEDHKILANKDIQRAETVSVGLRCVKGMNKIRIRVICLDYEIDPASDENDVQVSFFHRSEESPTDEYDFINGNAYANVLINGETIEPLEVKSCPKVRVKSEMKLAKNSLERNLLIGHLDNQGRAISIYNLEVFKFPKKETYQFSEMLDLIRFTNCWNNFEYKENSFVTKELEGVSAGEEPYQCRIKNRGDAPDFTISNAPDLFHYSTLY